MTRPWLGSDHGWCRPWYGVDHCMVRAVNHGVERTTPLCGSWRDVDHGVTWAKPS